MPRIPTSLTLRSLIAMIVALGVMKLIPTLDNAAAQQIGEAIATIVGLLGAAGVGAGYMRRVYTPAAPEIEAQAAAHVQGFLGKQGWRDVRGGLKDAGASVLMTLFEATMRRLLDERDRNAAWVPPHQRFADVAGDEDPPRGGVVG